MKNNIEYLLSGRYALFTDPITKIGGEKSTYPIPTYQALKGITESIYWKPTLNWVIDKARVVQRIRTQSKNIKALMMNLAYGKNRHDLSIYTYLFDVAYQVKAHFEWNLQRDDLAHDRNENKHYQIAQRMLEKGGRRDIFLGTRECQGYVEPCRFGEGTGANDNEGEIAYGLMFHSFQYPSESGIQTLSACFWQAKTRNGIIQFPRPEECKLTRSIRPMAHQKIRVNTDEVIDL